MKLSLQGVWIGLVVLLAWPAIAQPVPPASRRQEVVETITLRRAHEMALQHNYNMKNVDESIHQAEIYRFPLDREARLAVIRRLLANSVPVIVLQLLEPGSDIGHYRVMQGYDDVAGEFICDDPLLGRDYRMSYDVFARLLNRAGALFVPVHPPAQEPLVEEVIHEVYARRWTDTDGLSCAQMLRR